MPIRPEERRRYPADWKAISLRIREREGQKCKWCGAPNGALIVRDTRIPAIWTLHEHDGVCCGEGCKAIRVVLTVAHLDRVPEHCDDDNLVALCQLHHLRYDAKHHQKNAADTRARKRDLKSGQQAFVGFR